jgi:hypothetical protein
MCARAARVRPRTSSLTCCSVLLVIMQQSMLRVVGHPAYHLLAVNAAERALSFCAEVHLGVLQSSFMSRCKWHATRVLGMMTVKILATRTETS